jgi:hypothetical protein
VFTNKTIIAASLLLHSIIGDGQGRWEAYQGNYDGGIGSVLVNMSLKHEADFSKYPLLLVTGPNCIKCDTSGLPAKEEFEKLDKILDQSEIVISSKTAYLNAGVFTYNNHRLGYYYIKDSIGVRNVLKKMYHDKYPGYKYVIDISADKEGKAYKEFLYPNDTIYEHILNLKVITRLLDADDKLDKPRPVTHWLYFETSADRNSFIPHAKMKGYTIQYLGKTGAGIHPYELRIQHTTAVKADIIVPIIIELRNEAKKYNGDYDGWETTVAK